MVENGSGQKVNPISGFFNKLTKHISHQVLRRGVQLLVTGYIAFLAVQHVIVGEDSGIITASPEAFCPFGGLETLFKYIASGGTFVSHTHLSNIVIFIAVMVIAILFRSAFCGWICPLGFIQDLANRFSQSIQKKIPGLRHAILTAKKKNPWFQVADRYLRLVKYLVLVWAVGGSAYFGYMVFRDYDPWSALINLAEFNFTPGVIILIALLLSSLVIERPWCRYACPLGAISGLIGKLSPTYLKREESACTSCKICSKSCPMGLNIHSAKKITSVDCIGCLECVGSCPRQGALEVKFGLPFLDK